MASGMRTEYRIFAGLGLVLAAVGLFEILLGLTSSPSWTVLGIDSDIIAGIAMIVSGLSGIGAARYHYLRRS